MHLCGKLTTVRLRETAWEGYLGRIRRDEYVVVIAFSLANLLLHLLTNGIWGFHRDELLYMAMGDHLDWGHRTLDDSAAVLIYCENYGQAGAAAHVLGNRIPEPVSFSDSFRLWAPRRLDPEINTLICVNDEMGDNVAGLFEDVRLQGTVSTPFARERGTHVWVCRQPRRSLHAFWRSISTVGRDG